MLGQWPCTWDGIADSGASFSQWNDVVHSWLFWLPSKMFARKHAIVASPMQKHHWQLYCMLTPHWMSGYPTGLDWNCKIYCLQWCPKCTWIVFRWGSHGRCDSVLRCQWSANSNLNFPVCNYFCQHWPMDLVLPSCILIAGLYNLADFVRKLRLFSF